VIPGRRFLQSAVFQLQVISSGKFKRGSQLLVFLFNDLLLFTQIKGKDSRRLSGGTKSPQIFRMSPRNKVKNKVVEFMYLENITINDKGHVSESFIEFIAPGKRVVVGVEELKVKQEWLKNLRTQITTWKIQKGIVEKKEKREKLAESKKRDERIGSTVVAGEIVGDKKNM